MPWTGATTGRKIRPTINEHFKQFNKLAEIQEDIITGQINESFGSG